MNLKIQPQPFMQPAGHVPLTTAHQHFDGNQ